VPIRPIDRQLGEQDARPLGNVARYPADIGPFLATDRDRVSDAELAALIAPGETVLLIGPAPAVPDGWQLEALGEIVQMVFDGPIVPRDVAIELLDDRAAVNELAALVYPHYFRPRTTVLGRYFGVRDAGRLVAMIGERMAMPGLREIARCARIPMRSVADSRARCSRFSPPIWSRAARSRSCTSARRTNARAGSTSRTAIARAG
jgi:hypothetical protein